MEAACSFLVEQEEVQPTPNYRGAEQGDVDGPLEWSPQEPSLGSARTTQQTQEDFKTNNAAECNVPKLSTWRPGKAHRSGRSATCSKRRRSTGSWMTATSCVTQCSTHERVQVCQDPQTEFALLRESLGVSRMNHILRVHGYTLLHEEEAKTFNEVGQRSHERRFPGFTEDSAEQAVLCASQSGFGHKRSTDVARAAHLGALIADS